MALWLCYLALCRLLGPARSSRRDELDKDIELMLLRHEVRILAPGPRTCAPAQGGSGDSRRAVPASLAQHSCEAGNRLWCCSKFDDHRLAWNPGSELGQRQSPAPAKTPPPQRSKSSERAQSRGDMETPAAGPELKSAREWVPGPVAARRQDPAVKQEVAAANRPEHEDRRRLVRVATAGVDRRGTEESHQSGESGGVAAGIATGRRRARPASVGARGSGHRRRLRSQA